MTTRHEAPVQNADRFHGGFELDELSAVKRLRNFYRRNFRNGYSDDSFIVWIEQVLEYMEWDKRSREDN